MKLTEDPKKQTLPGSKAAFRLLGSDGEAPPLSSVQFQAPGPSRYSWRPSRAYRVSAVRRAAIGRGATSPGWPGAASLASRGPGVPYCEASPRGATAATLGQAGTGDHPYPSPSLHVNPDQALTSDLALLPASQQLCEPLPSLAESRAFAQQSLHRLSPAHRRLEQPALYQVRAGLRPQPSLCSLPPWPHHPHVSPLQVALSEKLQALVDRLSARRAL